MNRREMKPHNIDWASRLTTAAPGARLLPGACPSRAAPAPHRATFWDIEAYDRFDAAAMQIAAIVPERVEILKVVLLPRNVRKSHRPLFGVLVNLLPEIEHAHVRQAKLQCLDLRGKEPDQTLPRGGDLDGAPDSRKQDGEPAGELGGDDALIKCSEGVKAGVWIFPDDSPLTIMTTMTASKRIKPTRFGARRRKSHI